MSICRGGRRLAQGRHNLAAAGLAERAWRQRWESARLFLTADGEAGKHLGNETIRWHPEQGWVEVKLPAPLAHLANRPYDRYRIENVHFGYRGGDVAGQAESGAVRYDISYDPGKRRWYLDASWTTWPRSLPALDDLRAGPVLAADLNAGHVAAWVVDPAGNPVGQPRSIPLELAGLPTAIRDGRLRAAISSLLALARASGCAAVVIEDLDFAQARDQGRERSGRRPSRGRRGRAFRRTVAGIPAARFRDRLVQMASNTGLAVVAVDPAYTSRWGVQHWLGAVQHISTAASGHHAQDRSGPPEAAIPYSLLR